MRLAILSDVHANLEALRATLADIGRAGADRLVCLGDIVGYHADPAACIELLRRANAICLAGNHDWAVAGRITTEGFHTAAARAVDWTRQRLGAVDLRFLAELPAEACIVGRIVAVHGALLPEGGCVTTRLDTEAARRATLAALRAHPSGARICAFGHTHELGLHELRGGVLRAAPGEMLRLREDTPYLLNPGTVGQPRSAERRATYLLLDLERDEVAVRRVAYDAGPTLAKARAAGLLPPLRGAARARAAAGRALRRVGLHGLVTRVLRGPG